MQIIKTTIIFFSIIFSIFLFTPQTVEASAASTLSSGADTTAGQAGLESTDINVTIASIVGNLLSMIGVLFFILMLYGGILWMTARGDTDQTQKAMNTLIAATVGIVIVLASYAITDFVLGSIGGGSSDNNPSDQNTVTSCSQRGNAQCMNIRNCAGVSGNSESKLKETCDNSNWCQRNLCSGNWENVCCSKSK